MPSTIEKVHRERKGRNFTVLAVDIQEDPRKVESWVKANGITLPVLLDRDGAVTAAYHVTVTPATVLIARDGKMVARAAGTRPWNDSAGRALLDALLAAP